MKISSLQLEAFYATARLRSFSRAASNLGVTQSALSQRISKLEDDLEVTLFIRDPSRPILTEAGEMLLRFCQISSSLEEEVLDQLKSSVGQLSGTVRIAGFSSILRSVIIPSLAEFLRANPKVQCEFRSYEVIDLAQVLKNAQADLVVLDYHLDRKGIAEHVLGLEEYVVIESTKYPSAENLYLDHGPHDNATESYFKMQTSTPQNLRRSFMGDVYGIIDGVEQGLGRAVMSKHLLASNKRVQIVKGYKRYTRPVTLNYYQQGYYSTLHKSVVKVLCEGATKHLPQK